MIRDDVVPTPITDAWPNAVPCLRSRLSTWVLQELEPLAIFILGVHPTDACMILGILNALEWCSEPRVPRHRHQPDGVLRISRLMRAAEHHDGCFAQDHVRLQCRMAPSVFSCSAGLPWCHGRCTQSNASSLWLRRMARSLPKLGHHMHTHTYSGVL